MNAVWAAWQRFWFDPQPVSTLILFRVAYGVVAFFWCLTAMPDAADLFSRDGILPERPERDGSWSLLDLWDSGTLAILIVVAMTIAALGLVIGRYPRAAAVILFVGFVSLSARNPYVGNSGDGLLRTFALFLVLAPAVSSDEPGARRAPIALRLVQIQLATAYLSTVWAKARGVTWNDGTAVSYAFRTEDLVRFPMPDVGDWLLLTNVLTTGVLALELSLGVLVWHRVLRPWVLAGGVLLHLGIDYRIRVGFFSWIMLAGYVAWVPPDTAGRIIGGFRARLPSARGPQEARRAPG